jgi:hypothetical protein
MTQNGFIWLQVPYKAVALFFDPEIILLKRCNR